MADVNASTEANAPVHVQSEPKDDIAVAHHQANATDSLADDDQKSIRQQHGVEEVEAITSTWSKSALIATYACFFIIFFIISLEEQIQSNLTAYVTSAFLEHSLTTTTSTLSTVIAGVAKFPIAKMIDVWGRPEGYLVMVAITTIGLIMMAACKNVETYAAAQVFYWVGFDGVYYVLDVFMADTSSLRNRALVFAFSTTPYIATAFAGPAAAQSFLDTSGWPWAFGSFAIITPVVFSPVAFIFFKYRNQARQQGLTEKATTGRTWTESLKYYVIEFDLLGLILIIGGFALLLLPLTLASSSAEKWRTPSIICMLVFGIVGLILFVVYERFWAPVSFVPFHLLRDRTVLGACILSMTLYISFYCWDSYFTSYLQVVHGLSVTDAGYVLSTYNIGSCFWGVIVGILVRITNRFKWLAMCAVPVYILGTALMIHFRGSGFQIGYIVMCQIFIAFAGGTLVVCEDMAVMAAAEHTAVAVVLALVSVFSGIGGGIGLGISGAIWTNTFPQKLEEYLPDDLKANATLIYASLTTQLSYPEGSAARDAIIEAYLYSQKRMCIAATCIMILAVPAVLIWKDYNVKNIRQVKGTVVDI